jgi:hypothetical protein
MGVLLPSDGLNGEDGIVVEVFGGSHALSNKNKYNRQKRKELI